jgi:hypothetical protein
MSVSRRKWFMRKSDFVDRPAPVQTLLCRNTGATQSMRRFPAR